MPGVLCALRGGVSSLSTLEKAIILSKKRSLPLYFLYVVDLESLSRAGIRSFRYILKEMCNLGESITLYAQRKAKSRGIKSRGEVRKGKVEDEIINVSKEINAEIVIVGYPQGKKEIDIFTDKRLKKFAKRIENETSSRVILT